MTFKGSLGWLLVFTMTEKAEGSVVHKCVGADGNLTYTQGACPDGSAGQPYWAYSPPPGSVAPTLPARAQPHRPKAASLVAEPAARQPASKHRQSKRSLQKPAKKKKPPKYRPWKS